MCGLSNLRDFGAPQHLHVSRQLVPYYNHIGMPPVAKNPAFKSKSKATDTAPNKDLNEDDYFLTSVRVPNRSPARSEFGDEYRQEDVLAPFLPKHIQAYLRQNGLEAFLVPADGNCLYRALTFGPEWNRHRMARGATAGYLSGLKQDANILAMLLTDDQVEEIRQGIVTPESH